MDLTVENIRGAAGLRLAGELDLGSVSAVEQPLKQAVALGGPLIVDLTELRFIDSSGLHALLKAAREVADNGWCVYLHVDEGLPRRLLSLIKAEAVPNLHVIDHAGFTPPAEAPPTL